MPVASPRSPVPCRAARQLRPHDPFDAVVEHVQFVVHREPDPAWRLRPTRNERCHILAFAESGRVRYDVAGQAYDIAAGDLLLFQPGQDHAAVADPDDPWSFYSAGFTLRYPGDASRERFKSLASVVRMDNPAEIAALFNELDRYWTLGEPGGILRCRGLLLQMLAARIRTSVGQDQGLHHARRIRKVMARLAGDPTRTWRVDQLAELADLSPSHFRSLFRRVAGTSVVRYQNQVRIQRAKDLLLSGECNVTQAADRLGFRNVYYFSRLFKKMTGQNPSAFLDG